MKKKKGGIKVTYSWLAQPYYMHMITEIAVGNNFSLSDQLIGTEFDCSVRNDCI